jgi:hypothetical protein
VGDFLSAAAGALVGLASGLSIEWWKSSRDELAAVCEGFCADIVNSAEAACLVWGSSATDRDNALNTARVLGFQRRLSGYNALVTRRLHDAALDDIQSALAAYFDACSGADFDSPERKPDDSRIRTIQDAAADVILAVRSGFADKVDFREFMFRQLQRLPPLHRR